MSPRINTREDLLEALKWWLLDREMDGEDYVMYLGDIDLNGEDLSKNEIHPNGKS